MTQTLSPIDLQAWDKALNGPNPDYQKLYEEMLDANKKSSADNVAILWRLAKVTYMVSLNTLDLKEIKEKTQEGLNYAQKVVNIDSNNFQGNLWLANTAGKLALIEESLEPKLK